MRPPGTWNMAKPKTHASTRTPQRSKNMPFSPLSRKPDSERTAAPICTGAEESGGLSSVMTPAAAQADLQSTRMEQDEHDPL